MTKSMNNLETNKVELEQKIYACWLDTIYWLASGSKYKLLEAAGSAKSIYDMSEKEVEAIAGTKCRERFLQHKKLHHPQKVWNGIAKLGISYTYCQASDFPQKLIKIPDPPFGMFYKGKLPDKKTPAVAMIGARKCSEYGRCMAERFAQEFTSYGIDIISGMASGIDGISQEAAVNAGGTSYGVLGCGVNVVYPKTNEPLYRKLLEKGGILSEYPPGMEPRPMLFPPRNRIISALSDVVLVIEARQKSGTLITVDMALEQGKEVYAVPGRCTDGLSMGCNALLRQGAVAATAPEDIIEDMHWKVMTNFKKNRDTQKEKTKQIKSGLSQTAQNIYRVLDIQSVPKDTIIIKLAQQGCKDTMSQIYQGLAELELKGLAVCQGGCYRLP